jgi:hypothetical protein
MKYRGLWKVIIFPVITFGIYEIYWLYATRKELVALGQRVPRVIILFIPFIVLLFSGFLVSTINGDLTGASASGSAHSLANILAFVLFIPALIACFVVPLVWYFYYSRAASAVANNNPSIGTMYALWLVLTFVGFGIIWPAIVQDGFNKVATEKPGS